MAFVGLICCIKASAYLFDGNFILSFVGFAIGLIEIIAAVAMAACDIELRK